MNDIFNNILPLILVFALGHLLKRTGFLTRDNADLLLKLFFYLALPSMILLSIPLVPLTVELITLPLITISMFFISLGVASLCSRFYQLERESLGVFLIGSIILNGAFAFPFVFVVYGEKGIAMAYLFDFGNAIVALSIAYYLACRYGSTSKSQTTLYRKFFLSPPLLALVVSIALNLTETPLPAVGIELLRIFSGMATPLIMLALGVYFNHRIVKVRPLFTVVGIRMLGGLMLGYIFVTIFALSGLSRTIVLVMSVCPSAMNTLAYASMEGLDKEFAASIVSYTTVISMFMMSLMIFIHQ